MSFKKFLLIVFTIIPVSLYSQCLPLDSTLAAGNAFETGERLFYIIHYKWLGIRTDVGAAQVTLVDGGRHNGKDISHSVVNGWTFNFWDNFFKVRDTYESKFYVDGVRPVYFHRDIHEGRYKVQNYYDWDESDTIHAKVIKKHKTIDTLLPGNECTFDILTLFYFARNIDFDALEKGRNNPVSFAIDEDVFNIYFRFIGREEKKIPKLGVYKTMKFAAKVVAGEVFTGEQEMYIWVSDDKNRVPLLFQSPIIVGSVYGRLVRWDNLKYPFDCKVI